MLAFPAVRNYEEPDDSDEDGSCAVTVQASDGTNTHTIDRSAGQHTRLIRDTTEISLPTAVTLSVSPASVAENAGATTLTLATDASVTVTVGQSGDTAVAGVDYTAAGLVTVPITAGQGSRQATFTLTPAALGPRPVFPVVAASVRQHPGVHRVTLVGAGHDEPAGSVNSMATSAPRTSVVPMVSHSSAGWTQPDPVMSTRIS